MGCIPLLGRVASFARQAGMGRAVARMRDTADSFCVKAGLFPLKVRVDDGTHLYGLFRHRSFLAEIQNGYESHFRSLFLDTLRSGMVVIDGGAHIGLYSLLASRRVGTKGTILAFEPDPLNLAALHHNIERNECRNVIPLAKALSDREGHTEFYSNYGTISSSLFRRLGPYPASRVPVDTTTLDRELEGMDLSSVLIKLDLEGAEPLAIEGMQRTVDRASEVVLFIEINPAALGAGGYEPTRLVQELQNLGFSLSFIDEAQRALLPVRKLSSLTKGNLYGRLSK